VRGAHAPRPAFLGRRGLRRRDGQASHGLGRVPCYGSHGVRAHASRVRQPANVGAVMDWHPKDVNLTLVAEYRDSECDEWYITARWRDREVDRCDLYEGAGCSCNEPYESLNALADLTEVYGLPDLMSKVNFSPRDKTWFIAAYFDYKSRV